jgi:hypothetical protein
MIKRSPNFAIVVWACLVMASSPWVAAQSAADAKWKPVEDTHHHGSIPGAQEGVTVKAALALGSWTSLGDVLRPQTALDSESPHVVYMHIEGHGEQCRWPGQFTRR